MNVLFGEIIKRNRKQKGLSLEKLSEKCDIEKSYISRLEKGDRSNPGFANVCALAKALDLDAKEVLQSFGYNQLGKESLLESNKDIEKELYIHEEKTNINQIHELIENYVTNSDTPYGYIPELISLLEETRQQYQNRIQ